MARPLPVAAKAASSSTLVVPVDAGFTLFCSKGTRAEAKEQERSPMSQSVDEYLKRSKLWRDEMLLLRTIVLEAKLDEDLKWGKPCYSAGGSNIAIFQPFKGCLAMMFFKGVLLKDAKGLLVSNGPNSHAGRRFEFTSTSEITKQRPAIKAYIKEAIEIETSGQKIKTKKRPEPVPDELEDVFEKKPRFKAAFEALTPGRQRAYILYFSGAKQSATRSSRIAKCIPDILDGRGLNER
jgi:uncharacterized protein YdeI (YjbR/CyaY-like superfamily)